MTPRHRRTPRETSTDQRGFSLVELVVAVSLMVVALATLFETLRSSEGGFRMQLEAADLEQRVRAAADQLASDLKAEIGRAHV